LAVSCPGSMLLNTEKPGCSVMCKRRTNRRGQRGSKFDCKRNQRSFSFVRMVAGSEYRLILAFPSRTGRGMAERISWGPLRFRTFSSAFIDENMTTGEQIEGEQLLAQVAGIKANIGQPIGPFHVGSCPARQADRRPLGGTDIRIPQFETSILRREQGCPGPPHSRSAATGTADSPNRVFRAARPPRQRPLASATRHPTG